MVSGSLSLLNFYFEKNILLVCMRGSRAAAPIGDKGLQNGEIFCLSVCLFVLGVSWGPLWSQGGDLGPLVTDKVGGKKFGLILDFSPRLPDIIHD